MRGQLARARRQSPFRGPSQYHLPHTDTVSPRICPDTYTKHCRANGRRIVFTAGCRETRLAAGGHDGTGRSFRRPASRADGRQQASRLRASFIHYRSTPFAALHSPYIALPAKITRVCSGETLSVHYSRAPRRWSHLSPPSPSLPARVCISALFRKAGRFVQSAV